MEKNLEQGSSETTREITIKKDPKGIQREENFYN